MCFMGGSTPPPPPPAPEPEPPLRLVKKSDQAAQDGSQQQAAKLGTRALTIDLLPGVKGGSGLSIK